MRKLPRGNERHVISAGYVTNYIVHLGEKRLDVIAAFDTLAKAVAHYPGALVSESAMMKARERGEIGDVAAAAGVEPA